MRRVDRKKPRKLWLKIPIIVVLLLVLSIGIYAIVMYNLTKNTVNEKMHDPVETIDTDVTKEKLKETKPLNVLLLGIDAQSSDAGRSDALMVMQLNPDDDSIKLISIPRDTRATIVGKGIEDKINHAYAFGGTSMAVETVENLLDIELDFYVSMNMDGLVELVNELGSITVDNEVAWSDSTYQFPEGPTVMDGDKTMAFVRMRKQDPLGDFGRTKRQRQVIQGVIEAGATVGSVPKFGGMIEVLGNNMATNMDFDDMKKLFGSYKDTRRNFTEYMMEGTGQNIGGIYYLIVPDEEVQKVHLMLTE